jgi:CheY-like chemotaxis protein
VWPRCLLHEGVCYTKDGTSALQALQESDFDFAIMDVMMPGMDGLAVTRAARENERLRSPPIAIVTALSTQEDRERVMAAGADEYLSKPFHIVQIAELVTRLRRKSPMPVGRYQLVSQIGEGSSKRVDETNDPGTDRPVAGGVFSGGSFGTSARERFFRETREMMELGEHPNVVTVLDAAEHHDEPCIVMELMPAADSTRSSMATAACASRSTERWRSPPTSPRACTSYTVRASSTATSSQQTSG